MLLSKDRIGLPTTDDMNTMKTIYYDVLMSTTCDELRDLHTGPLYSPSLILLLPSEGRLSEYTRRSKASKLEDKSREESLRRCRLFWRLLPRLSWHAQRPKAANGILNEMDRYLWQQKLSKDSNQGFLAILLL